MMSASIRRKRIGRVIIKHRHRLLPDDWSTIVLVVNKVYRAAGYFHARIQHGFVNSIAIHSRSAERRD